MANQSLNNLGKLLFESEGASFGVDPGGAGTYLPVIGVPDFGPAIRRALEDETLRQKMVALPMLMGAAGATECEFTTSLHMRGFSNTVPAAAPTQHFLATLIAAALGNLVASTDVPTLTEAGCTTQLVKCTNASLAFGNKSYAGGFYGIEVSNTPSVFEGRFATDLDESAATDDLTFSPLGDAAIVLGAAPGVGDSVYTGVTAYHIDSFDATNAPSYTVTWQGHTQEDYLHVHGCRPVRLVITFTTGEHVRCEITWRAVGLTSGDAAAALDAQAVVLPAPEVFADAPACFLTDGTANLDPLLIRSAVFTYEVELAQEASPTATYGVAGQTKTSATVTAEIDPLFDANGDQLETWRESQAGLYLECTMGTQPGRLIGCRMPWCHIRDGAYRAERDGLITKPITLAAADYQTESGDDDVHTQAGGGDDEPADDNPVSKIFSVGFA